MMRETIPLALASQVPSRALVNYAEGLNWQPVTGTNGVLAVFHRPDSRLHQVLIPTDEGLSDYAEAVAEAVRKLAEYEKRPARDVLDHLLLPPADLLGFREVSPDSDAGNLPFDHAVRMVAGTRRLLLSVAHSALVSQPYHPRLSRSEADEFIGRCRLGQTGRGSFVLNVACPLDVQLPLPGVGEPYARRVTSLLMQSLDSLAKAADAVNVAELLDPTRTPGMSANLCESLVQMRPAGDRSSLTVSAEWSRTLLPPSREPRRQVQLRQEVFEVAQELAPRLRTVPQPRPSRFIGFVDVLRGQPSRDDPRPAGEVDFTIFDDEQGQISARGVLDADDYAKAGAAHLASEVVAFKGILRPLPRLSRVDEISDFDIVTFGEDDIPQTNLAD